jgi:hypothetical protein
MIPENMTDPNDSSSTVLWDDLTTAEQTEALKLFKEIVKRTNVHWVIHINLKGSSNPNSSVAEWERLWPHHVYPLKFASAEDAWSYLAISPDPTLRPQNLKSWSVEAVRNPKDHIPHPRVRKPDLILNPKSRKTRR